MGRDFDGVDDDITATITAADSDWTLGCWIKARTAGEGGNSGRIIEVTNDPNNVLRQNLRFLTGSGRLRISHQYSSLNHEWNTDTTGDGLLPLNEWVCVFGWRNDSAVTMGAYAGTLTRGVYEMPGALQSPTGTKGTTGTKALIGNRPALDFTFDGIIARAFFTARVLTQDECELFRLGYVGHLFDSSLRFFMPLDSPTVSRAEDLSANAAHGTVNGPVLAEDPPVPLVWGGHVLLAPPPALTAVGKDSDQRWGVRTTAGRPADTRWAVRALAGDESDQQWGVRALAGDESDQQWGVRALAGDESDQQWGVRAVLGDTVDTRWAVLVPVGDESDEQWGVRALAGDESDTRWGVRALVGDESDTRWAVHALAGDESDLRWDVLTSASVSDTVSLRWAVHTLAGDQADTRWAVRVLAGDTATVLWGVRIRAGDSGEFRWQLRQLAGDQADVRWRVIGPVGQWRHFDARSATAGVDSGVAGVTGRLSVTGN